jgi:multiple sugar transport system substrate-binding protein
MSRKVDYFMKWVIFGVFIGATALLLLDLATMPKPQYEGVAQLVWATDGNPAREEQMAMFKDWHLKTYGQKIDIRIDPSNAGREKVVIQSAAGVGPDLFDMYGSTDIERLVKSGIILDVTDEAKKHGFAKEAIWPGIWPSFVYEGRQYGAPTNAGSFVILFNKKLFDAEGVPYPEPASWTWTQFLEVAQKFTHKRPDGTMQFGMLEVDPIQLIYQNDGRIFTPDGTRCIADSPDAIEAMQFYYDLRYKYHVMPTSSDIQSMTAAGGWGGSVNTFSNDHFAMTSGARWWLTGYVRDTRKAMESGKPSPFKLGAAPLPYFKHPAGLTQSRCTGINRTSKNVKYALRFLEFLASEPYNRQINSSYDAFAPMIKYDTGPEGVTAGPPPPSGLEIANSPLWIKSMRVSRDVEISPFLPPFRFQRLWKEQTDLLVAQKCTAAAMMKTFTRLVNNEIQVNLAHDAKLRARYDAAVAKESVR